MMRKLVIGALAATVLVAACGGSTKGNGSTGAGGTGGGSSTTAAGGGGNDAFGQLTAKASTADIKITFTDNNGKSTTYVQDGAGKTAFVSGDSEIIYDGKNSISCNGSGAKATCTQIPGSGGNLSAVFTGLFSLYRGINSSLYAGHVSSATIAGRDATCVTFKASDYAAFAAFANQHGYDATASATVCADNETGFLLKLASTGGSTETNLFLATAVATSSPGDFEPPSPPSTIPSITLPGGGTVPSVSVP